MAVDDTKRDESCQQFYHPNKRNAVFVEWRWHLPRIDDPYRHRKQPVFTIVHDLERDILVTVYLADGESK